MSDMMEIDTGDEMTTRILAVGQAVFRAADNLKRAAERVTTGMPHLAVPAHVHRCWAWMEERQGGGVSHRVSLPDVMELANLHAPGIALRDHDGADDESVTI